ncbi:AbrB family transcriptional regulator [Niallia sp. XMNu-256]|uniref:AbrB family transcriptional regulator n=1 Tax=Niallia sp. XMNu-256 TaxID=3082444 RepID=UPI0030CF815F
MKLNKRLLQNIAFILLSSFGGFILVWAGLDIGWIIGTLIMAAFLSFRPLRWLKDPDHPEKGMPTYWLRIGQTILAVELGQKINLSVISTFQKHWLTITIMLLLSVVFSLLSGLLIWKFSQTDMITSFFATAPGGIVVMPGLAQDIGANTGVVSIVQTMRVFLVVILIPIIASTWFVTGETSLMSTNQAVTTITNTFGLSQLGGTVLLFLAAWGGKFIGKLLRFPSPVLIGGLVGVAVVQGLYYLILDSELIVWWPALIMIIAQVLMASSIGARFQRSMFQNIGKLLFVAFISTVGLILAMLICAYFVSVITGISLITSVLAFAPGGVAEMAATAIILEADSTFVVAVQVLRIVVVILVLPPLFKLMSRRQIHKKYDDSKVSV